MIPFTPLKFLLLLILSCCFLSVIYANPVAKIARNGVVQGRDTTILVCRGSSVTFVDLSENRSNRFWRLSGQTLGSPGDSLQSIMIMFSVIRVDTLVLRVDSAGVPSDSMRIFVNVTAPTSSFTFTNNNTCAGTNISFTPTSTGTTPFTYLWNFGTGVGAPDNSNSSAPIVVYSPASGSGTATYSATLTTTDANGCSTVSPSQTVSVKRLPDASVSDFLTLFKNCGASLSSPNYLIEIENSSTTASSNTNYNINWGDGTTVRSFTTWVLGDTAMHQYTALGSFNLTVTVVSNNGCSKTEQYVVFNGTNPGAGVYSAPVSTIGCAPQTFAYTVTPVAKANTPSTTYSVYFDDGTPVMNYTQSNLPDTIFKTFTKSPCSMSPPQTLFKLYAVTYNPCFPAGRNSSVDAANISQKPTANFVTSNNDWTYCKESPVTFVNISSSGFANNNGTCDTALIKSWQITPGVLNTDWTVSGSLSNSNSIVVTFINPGTYNIRLAVRHASISPSLLEPCNRDTIIKTVCIQPIPIPAFISTSTNGTRCAPDTISFTNTSNTLTSCGNTTYTWSKQGTSPAISFVGGTNLNSINPKIYFATPGNYTIRLAVTNKCGTVNKDTIIVIKGPPIVTLPVDRTLCDSTIILYSNPPSNYNANGGTISTYLWSVTPSGTSFVNNVNNIALPSIFFPISNLSPTVYKVVSVATNECGSGRDTQTVIVNPKVLPPQMRDTFSCGSKIFTLNGTPGTNGSILKWYTTPTGVTALVTNNSYITPNITSTTNYYVSSYNSTTTCESLRDTLKITINPIPNAPTASNVSRCGPVIMTLSATIGTNGNNLKWYSLASGGIPLYTGITYSTTVLSTTTFYIASFDSITGCESSGRTPLTVTINPVPTVNAGNDTSFCFLPGTIDLNAFLSVTPSNSSKTWTGTGVTAGGIFTPNTAGLGLVTLIITATHPTSSCQSRDTLVVNVINATIPNAGNDTSVCRNSPAFQLLASPAGGTWSGTGVTSGGIFTPSTAGTFNAVYSLGSGSCLARDTVKITVNSLPSPNFTLPSGICPNQTIALSSSVDSLYRWSIRNSKNYSNSIIADSNAQNTNLTFPENQSNDTALFTIKLILTTNAGCKDSLSRSIVLNRRPDIVFSVPPISCGPDSVTVINSTTPSTNITWLWSSDSTSIQFNTTSSLSPRIRFPLNNRNDSTRYKIRLQATTTNGIGVTGCLDRDSIFQTIYPKPQAGFTAITKDSCGPRTVVFTNTSNAKNNEPISSLTNSWMINSVNSSTLNNSALFSNSGVVDSLYNARLIVTSSRGCKDTTNQTITVWPNARALFTASSTTGCAPFNITSAITVNTFPGANNLYKWYRNDTLVSNSTSSLFPPYTITNANDSVRIKLVTTSLKGCKDDSMSMVFKTIANPAPNFTLNSNTGCSPLTVTIKDSSTTGVGLAWSFSNGASASGVGPFDITFTNPSNTVNRTDTVKLVITAGTSGCKDSISKVITLLPKPKAVFSLPNVVCADTFKTVINSSIFKSSSATYGWRFSTPTNNSISDTNATSPTFQFINNQGNIDSNYTIALRVTSIDGCVHDTIRNITINRRPLANFTIPQPNCGPSAITASNGTTNVASNWLWSSTPSLLITTSSSPNPSILFPVNTTNDSINYRIQLTATRTGTGCIDTTSRVVIIYPKPQANFTVLTKDSCGPRSVIFTNTSIAKNNELLSSLTNNWIIKNINSSTLNNSALFSNSGVIDSVDTARLIVTTMHGCKDTANQVVTVWPNAKASFTPSSTTGCAPFNLKSVITVDSLPSANALYKWYRNDTLVSSSTSSSFPPYTITNANDSVRIKLVTTSLNGCKDDSMVTVFKTIANPVPNFTMNINSGCSPLTVNIKDSSTTGVGLAWSFSNGASASGAGPFNITFVNPTNNVNKTDTVKLVITAGTSGCKDSISKVVTILPKPKAIFSIPNIACADTFKTAINTSIFKSSPATYGWRFLNQTNNSINDTNTQNPIFHFINNQGSNDSTYTIALRVTSIDGCVHDTARNIIINRRPLANFTIPQPNCGPSAINVSNGTINVASNWLWSSTPSLLITTSSSPNPSILFPVNTTNDSINYRIQLTATRTGTGCIDTTSRVVTIYPKPQANFTALTKDSCGPRTVVFTNTSNAKNNEPITSLVNNWTINNVISATPNNSAQFTNTGVVDSVYLAKLVVTTKHGCKDSTTDNITVKPNAKASFSFSLSLGCAPFSITSSNIVTASYPDANNSYTWYANGVYIGNTINFPGYTIVNANDSVQIKLVSGSLHNCKNDSISQWFKTIPNPVPNFQAIDSIGCTPLTVNFINTSTPATGLSYQWELGNSALTSSLNNPSATFYNTGTNDTIVKIKLITIAGGTGCKDSIEKRIIVKPLPRANFNFSDTSYCFPLRIQLTNTTNPPPAVNIEGYRWRVYGFGISNIGNDTASSNTTISFPDNQSGLVRNYAVSLTATSDYGCIDSVTKSTKIAYRPIANYNYINQSICSYQQTATNNTSQFANNYTWTPLSPNLVINNPNSFNVQVNGINTSNLIDSIFNLQLLATNNYGCRDSINRAITINPKPETSIETDTTEGCTPLSISFTNNTQSKTPNTYNWRLEKDVFSSQSDTVHIFNGSTLYDTTYLVRLVTTSTDGCRDTAFTSITAKASAKAKLSITDTLYCILNGFATVPIGNISFGSVDSFYFDFGDGSQLITTQDSTINHKYINEGIYTIKLRAKNDCRMSEDSVLFKVLKAPTPIYSSSDTLGCGPLKVKFTNNTVSFESKYHWNFGNGQTSNLPNPDTITFIQSKILDTTYIVRLTATNGCGIKTFQDTVRVLPIPVATFMISTDSGCSPLPVSFLNTSTGLPTSVKWDFGNGDSSKRYQPYPVTYRTEDSLTIYSIKLVATNTCGIDSAFKSVMVQPNSVRSFFTTSGATGCAPFTVKFFDFSVGGNSLSWNLGNNITSTIKNPTTTYNTPGKYNAYQYVNNGCSYDTSVVIINVLKVPNFGITKSKNAVCIGEQAQFNTVFQDSGSVIWYFGDGDSSESINPTHKWSTSGKKVITITMKSAQNSCPKTLYDTITVNPLPMVMININATQNCIYNSFLLNANGSSPGAFFTWQFGDNNSSNNPIVTHKYDSVGFFTIKLFAQNSFGCKDSAQTDVRTFPKPLSKFDYTPKDTCSGPVTVRFTNQSIGATSYLWDFGNGLQTTITNPTNTYATVGTYPMTLISGNEFGCYDTSSMQYNVYNIPKPAFTFTADNGCEPLTVTFKNTSIYGSSLRWDFGDGDTSSSLNPVHTYFNNGRYFVKLTVTEGGICSDSITQTKPIEVYPKPMANFEWKLVDNVRPYKFIDYRNTSTGANSYLWNLGDNQTERSLNPRHGFTPHGYYNTQLIAISDKGCLDTISYEVFVPEYNKGLFVPNAFTPDFGSDDVKVFKPVGIQLKTYHLKIYNKWGELIWETTELTDKGEPKVGWNGIDKNGNPCVQGAYVWAIEAEFTDGLPWEGMIYPTGSQKPVTSGNVTLIR